MEELYYVYATGGLILLYFAVQVAARRFDPFAPVWLFLVGYSQVYVVQAITYHDWALSARGKDLVAAANFRALWAIAWFLLVYQLGIGKKAAAVLPAPPRSWPPVVVGMISPPLVLWGLYCSGLFMRGGFQTTEDMSGEELLLLSFPFVMMVAAVMLIVTGRAIEKPPPVFLDRRASDRGRLRADLDVQRQAVALADRRAGDGLRLLYLTAQAALLAGSDLDRRGGSTGRDGRHRLEGQPQLRAVVPGLCPLSSATSSPRRSSRAST